MQNIYRIEGPACISFSGGRTSAYMLYQILQAWNGKLPDDVVVCFANTGKEMEETLRFVDRCSKEWSVPIVWVEYRTTEAKFEVVDFETASRDGEPFMELVAKKNYLPNPVTRFCTVELKILPMANYLKTIFGDYTKSELEKFSVIGIRADEQRRVAKIGIDRLPLVPAGVTSKIVGDFWAAHAFDLELPNINGKTMHGNCDLCFLKGGNIVQTLINEKPERALWWAKVETMVQSSGQATGQGARFRKDRPGYQQMYDYALAQTDWIGNTQEETIPCFCGD